MEGRFAAFAAAACVGLVAAVPAAGEGVDGFYRDTDFIGIDRVENVFSDQRGGTALRFDEAAHIRESYRKAYYAVKQADTASGNLFEEGNTNTYAFRKKLEQAVEEDVRLLAKHFDDKIMSNIEGRESEDEVIAEMLGYLRQARVRIDRCLETLTRFQRADVPEIHRTWAGAYAHMEVGLRRDWDRVPAWVEAMVAARSRAAEQIDWKNHNGSAQTLRRKRPESIERLNRLGATTREGGGRTFDGSAARRYAEAEPERRDDRAQTDTAPKVDIEEPAEDLKPDPDAKEGPDGADVPDLGGEKPQEAGYFSGLWNRVVGALNRMTGR